MPTEFAIAALVAMLGGLAIFAFGIFRRQAPAIIGGIFICASSAALGVWLTEQRVGPERAALQTALEANPQIYVDGQACAGPRRLAALFGQMDDSHADHSGPTRPMQVLLRSTKGHVDLLLYRDSARPTDWWVYADGPQERFAGEPGGEEGIAHGDPFAACAAG